MRFVHILLLVGTFAVVLSSLAGAVHVRSTHTFSARIAISSLQRGADNMIPLKRGDDGGASVAASSPVDVRGVSLAIDETPDGTFQNVTLHFRNTDNVNDKFFFIKNIDKVAILLNIAVQDTSTDRLCEATTTASCGRNSATHLIENAVWDSPLRDVHKIVFGLDVAGSPSSFGSAVSLASAAKHCRSGFLLATVELVEPHRTTFSYVLPASQLAQLVQDPAKAHYDLVPANATLGTRFIVAARTSAAHVVLDWRIARRPPIPPATVFLWANGKLVRSEFVAAVPVGGASFVTDLKLDVASIDKLTFSVVFSERWRDFKAVLHIRDAESTLQKLIAKARGASSSSVGVIESFKTNDPQLDLGITYHPLTNTTGVNFHCQPPAKLKDVLFHAAARFGTKLTTWVHAEENQPIVAGDTTQFEWHLADWTHVAAQGFGFPKELVFTVYFNLRRHDDSSASGDYDFSLMLEWLEENGAFVRPDTIDKVSFAKGGVGLKTRVQQHQQLLPAQTLLAALPYRVLLSHDVAQQHPTIQTIFNSAVFKSKRDAREITDTQLLGVTVFAMLGLDTAEQDTINWKLFFKNFPSEPPNLPFLHSPEDLKRRFEHTGVYDMALQMQREAAAEYDVVCAVIPAFATRYSLAEYKNWKAHVLTRSIRQKQKQGSAGVTFLAPLVDLLQHDHNKPSVELRFNDTSMAVSLFTLYDVSRNHVLTVDHGVVSGKFGKSHYAVVFGFAPGTAVDTVWFNGHVLTRNTSSAAVAPLLATYLTKGNRKISLEDAKKELRADLTVKLDLLEKKQAAQPDDMLKDASAVVIRVSEMRVLRLHAEALG